MGDRSTLLVDKLRKFGGLIRDAAERYAVPGKVDEEDVTQECLILINELMDRYPNCDPASDGFNALVKGAVYRRVISLTRKYLGKGRNYHRECYIDDASVISSSDRHPSSEMEYRETVDVIQSSLPEETKKLFTLLHTEPDNLMTKLEEYNTKVWNWPNGDKRSLKIKCRDPHRHEFLAFYLGWTKQKIRYHMSIIRSRTKEVLFES